MCPYSSSTRHRNIAPYTGTPSRGFRPPRSWRIHSRTGRHTPEGQPTGLWASLLCLTQCSSPRWGVRGLHPKQPKGRGLHKASAIHKTMVTKFLLIGRAQVSSALRAGPVVVGGPEPQPLPLRLFQKCVKDSSDVRETPSRGPFLFQDVVGLAQGLLGGGAQVKFPPRIPPARLRGWGLLENTAPPCLGTNDTWKLPADNRRVVNTGGWDRRGRSFPKGNACTGREPRQDRPGCSRSSHKHTER